MVTRAPSITLGGRYHLVERLAVGGMGEVWRADDGVLGRSVAVKVLREEHAGDPEFRRRFRTEAQHAAMLVHPNVAQVFDFGEGDESSGEPPYLVMELIRGEPLSALLAREAPLDPERTWSIIGQAASALAAAHDAGLVHRDIKPGNLLLCPDGMLKVTDFGIARATGASAVTTVGNVLGTPHYISPEQVAGEPVSAATDFYALGVVGYECLTGKRLYDGEPMAVLLAHRDQQPPALPAGIPAGLRDLVTALLDKDPAKRPTDGRAIAAQAERFNAPTVSMPALADAYPSAPTRATTAAPAVAVVDEEPKTSAFRLPEGVRSRRDTLLPIALLVVVLVIAAVLIGVVLKAGPSSSGHKSAASGQASSTPVRVASVQPFTGGSGSPDHPEEASLATDGNTSTAWYTQHYATSDFGSLRSGTGLVFDLGSPVAVKTLALRLAVPGVSVAVHAGNDQAGLLTSTVVGGASAAGSSLTLHPTTTARYWLVWFTRLASNDGGYRAGIAEASFRR